MNNLQPEGVDLEINGEVRNLLFDFGVIEKVQDKYGCHPIKAVQGMFWTEKQEDDTELSHYRATNVIDLLYILLNAEVSRRQFYDGSTALRKYTRDEIGHIVTRQNADAVVGAITQSWIGSVPDAEDEEPDEDDDIEPELKKKKQMK